MKINFENNKKNRTSLALFYLVIFFFIISIITKTNYIDFELVRSLFLPIIGISMLAILLDYLIFAHVLLVTAIFALISYQQLESVNNIIMFGLTFAFLLQMYVKIKNKSK